MLPEDGPSGPKHVGAEKRTFKHLNTIVVFYVLINSTFVGQEKFHMQQNILCLMNIKYLWVKR
jgi:hypothetical protein